MKHKYSDILRSSNSWAKRAKQAVSSTGDESNREARTKGGTLLLDLPEDVLQQIIKEVHHGGELGYWRGHACHGKQHSRPSFKRDVKYTNLLLVSKAFTEKVHLYENSIIMQRTTAIQLIAEEGFSLLGDSQQEIEISSAVLGCCLVIERFSRTASQGSLRKYKVGNQKHEEARARIFGIGFVMISNLQLQRLVRPDVVDGFVDSLTPLGLLVLRATNLMFYQHCVLIRSPILQLRAWRNGGFLEPSLYENFLIGCEWFGPDTNLLTLLAGQKLCHRCSDDPLRSFARSILREVTANTRWDLAISQRLQRAYPGTSFSEHMSEQLTDSYQIREATDTQQRWVGTDTIILLIKIGKMIANKSNKEVFGLLQHSNKDTNEEHTSGVD